MPLSIDPFAVERTNLAAKARAYDSARAHLPHQAKPVYVAGAGMIAEIDNSLHARELREARQKFITAVFAWEDSRFQ